jgi:hypothetical protein
LFTLTNSTPNSFLGIFNNGCFSRLTAPNFSFRRIVVTISNVVGQHSTNHIVMQKTSFLVGQLTKRRILSSSIISGGTAMAYSFSNKVNATSKTVYDFSALDIDKNKVDLKKYEGKVLLIVNVASA